MCKNFTFLFILFSAAFKKWKKRLEMLLWTYIYISICVQELNKILKIVWSKFQRGAGLFLAYSYFMGKSQPSCSILQVCFIKKHV